MLYCILNENRLIQTTTIYFFKNSKEYNMHDIPVKYYIKLSKCSENEKCDLCYKKNLYTYCSIDCSRRLCIFFSHPIISFVLSQIYNNTIHYIISMNKNIINVY